MALTKASLIDVNGQELILDADADTSITADTDDQIDIKIAGSDSYVITGGGDPIFKMQGSGHPQLRLKTTGTTDNTSIDFGDSGSETIGRILYNHNDDRLSLTVGGSERARFLANNLHLNGGADARIQLGGTASTGNDTVHIRGDNGNMKLMAASGGSYEFEQNGTQRFRIDADGGVGIGNPTATNYALEVEGAQIGRGSVYFHTTMPLADATYDLGHSSYRWRNMYLSGTTYSSDRNEKNTIVDSDLGLDFVKRLAPKSYKFNNGTSGRTHYGLIAQDVEDVLSDISKTGQDFAGFCKDEPTEPPKHDKDNPVTETRYGLRYTEFIAPMIKAIQEQQEQIEALQSEINTLKGE